MSLPTPTATADERSRALGAWLGALNVLFSAIAIAFSDLDALHHRGNSHSQPVGQLVFIVCILPGVMVGRWLGALAHHTRGEPLWHRLLVMFSICTVLVGILGSVGNLESMILPVMIPSAVNCLILERRTRAPSQLPTAALA